MEFFESLKEGRYGTLELNRSVGPTLLHALGLAVLIHFLVIFCSIRFVSEKTLEKLVPLPKTRSPLILTRDPNGVKLCSIDPRDLEKLRQGKTAVDSPEDPPVPVGVASDKIPDAATFTPFDVWPQPLPDFSPQPVCPAIALSAKISGKVICRVYVDKYGNVKKCMIASVVPKNLGFEEEVLKVIFQWKFTPALVQGNPVGVWISIPFRFKANQ